MVFFQKNNLFLRKRMVEEQIEAGGITDKKVIKAMLQVPREEFVPQNYRSGAYDDGALPIGCGQTISQPYTVAFMTQLLELKEGERVLEIGTGSGYQAAILAKITARVYTIERYRELLEKAQKVFKRLGLKNIQVRVGDGSKGWLEFAPYQAIIVTAAASKAPPALVKQLADGGRLVIPIGSDHWQELIRLTKQGEKLKKENFGLFAFVPLIEGEKE